MAKEANARYNNPAVSKYFGDQIRKVTPGQGAEHFACDVLNRMTEWEKTEGDDSPKRERHVYRGDAWHRCGLVVNDGSEAAKAIAFLYDGDNVIADLSAHGSAVEVDAVCVTLFVAQHLFMTDVASGKVYCYSQDGLGSVRTLTDATESIKDKLDLAWAAGTSESVPQRYGFTSQVRRVPGRRRAHAHRRPIR